MAEHWPTMPEPTDEALAARVAAGDVTAFALLYDRYDRPVYALAAHLLGPVEAEDVVQEAFLRLWRYAGQFDAARGRFAAWFLVIARHEVMARLRRRGQEQRRALADGIDRLLEEAPDPAIDIEEQAWQRQRGDLVLRALRELPAEQRRVLVLAYFGDLSQSTIAQSLGWPLGTVKKRIRLGLQKLRKALAEHESAAGDAVAAPPNGLIDPVQQRIKVPMKDGL